MEELVTTEFSCLLHGLGDALSVHRTLYLLVNNNNITWTTLKILLMNSIFLIGSMLIFQKCISPLLQSEEKTSSSTTTVIAWLLYEVMWLFPICGICYVCSSMWCQQLADLAYSHLNNNNTKKTKTISYALYATLLWLFLFLQMHVLASLSPLLTTFLTARISNTVVVGIVVAIGRGAELLGVLFACLLYGWYTFDPFWISSDVDPDERCRIMESSSFYFLGHGIPYVFLFRVLPLPPFTAYGIFLALFPFSVLIGCITDPKRYSSKRQIKFFSIARGLTLITLRYIDRNNNSNKLKVR